MEQLQDKIQTWLNSPEKDFFSGLDLLSKTTSNRMLIRNLTRKESKYSREKLIHELQKRLKHLPSITTHADSRSTDPEQSDNSEKSEKETAAPPVGPAGGESSSKEPPPPSGDKPLININQEDAKSAEQLEIVYSKMYNKKGMLINSLRGFAEHDNEGRKQVMEQIRGLAADMKDIRAKLDHFKEQGRLPTKADPPPAPSRRDTAIPDDPVNMKNSLLNLRSTISKLKRKIANGVPADKLPVFEALLKEKTEMVNEIERRIHGAG